MLRHRLNKIALAVSIIIHIILFLLYKPIAGISGLLDLQTPQSVEEEPLTFELVEPERPTELVETPADAAVDAPPEDAAFLSDKNARAQDMMTNESLMEGLSYSEGLSPLKTFAGAQPAIPNITQTQEEQKQGQEGDKNNRQPVEGEESPYDRGEAELYSEAFSAMAQKKFDKNVLQGAQSPSSNPNSFSDDVDWDQRESSARDLGGVSLSTYNWDYAPYILYMKKRIRNHLYPPQAFVQLGAISGQVTLSFILKRDGSVRDLKFIGNRGHNAFIEPSLNSIKASDPFKSLPNTFPDPYLELTWTFVYSVYR